VFWQDDDDDDDDPRLLHKQARVRRLSRDIENSRRVARRVFVIEHTRAEKSCAYTRISGKRAHLCTQHFAINYSRASVSGVRRRVLCAALGRTRQKVWWKKKIIKNLTRVNLRGKTKLNIRTRRVLFFTHTHTHTHQEETARTPVFTWEVRLGYRYSKRTRHTTQKTKTNRITTGLNNYKYLYTCIHTSRYNFLKIIIGKAHVQRVILHSENPEISKKQKKQKRIGHTLYIIYIYIFSRIIRNFRIVSHY